MLTPPRLLAGLDAGDPNREVTTAYIACQELRHLYAAPDLERARRRLHTFYQACALPGVPELEKLGRTTSAWEEQLLAYFTTGGVSNGPTEAVIIWSRLGGVFDVLDGGVEPRRRHVLYPCPRRPPRRLGMGVEGPQFGFTNRPGRGRRMRVQRIVPPVTGAESWTVVNDDLVMVDPAERYLAHLSALERSPNTVRAYAHGLRWWWEFLALREVDWQSATLEDVAEFVRWLRMPAGNVVVMHPDAARRSEATVNRHLLDASALVAAAK